MKHAYYTTHNTDILMFSVIAIVAVILIFRAWRRK